MFEFYKSEELSYSELEVNYNKTLELIESLEYKNWNSYSRKTTNKLLAEFFGTFWLVLGGCGSAVLAAGVADVGIGWAGVSLAFGLTVLTMAYAVGHISGGHFNPAVSLGLMLAGRFESKLLAPYWGAQVAGSIVAALVLYVIVSGAPDFAGVGGFASNGYAEASPGGYSMTAGLVTEIVLTAFFLVIILGATSKGAPAANKRAQTSRWPAAAAACNGVILPFSQLAASVLQPLGQ